MAETNGPLNKTALHTFHQECGGRMVPFAGYDMPVQYPEGIMKEHLWTRMHAGLFDVSHMGQISLSGEGAITALESLIPGDIAGLGIGQMRYSLLLNDRGGILDDLMITRRAGDLFLVVNAACKDADFAHLKSQLLPELNVSFVPDRALIALQGPESVDVLATFIPQIRNLTFMNGCSATWFGEDIYVTRSGYTGEDGFELSLPNALAEKAAKELLADDRVKPIGLGARDSLRLEAGLCLYGHDIDTVTTPVEASLTWTIAKGRRTGAGYPGAGIIMDQIAHGAARRRVGLKPIGRAPLREGAVLLDDAGVSIGTVTSGGFGPSIQGPVAMGYVTKDHAKIGNKLTSELRGKSVEVEVVRMPFTPHRYVK